jgi:excisionase family DNA binding protein
MRQLGSGTLPAQVMRAMVKRPEPLHTVSEAAAILNASEKTVRRLIKGGCLRAIRIGGLLRIAPADLDDLIRDHRSP